MTETKVTYSDIPECHVYPLRDDPKINTCTVDVEVPHDIAAPVYVYYKIENMYQNHRRYVKSRSYSQLAGKYHTADELKSDCDPVYRVQDLYPAQQKKLSGGVFEDLESPAIPCGLMAKSFFNDTLTFYKKYVKDTKTPNKDNIEFDLNTTDIAWTTDVGKFSNIKDEDLPEGVKSYKDIQWQDMEDPRFIVWMRNAGLPNFRKLYGVIDEDIKAGTYTLKVDAQYNVAPFEGKKQFVLSQANVLGGKNEMLYMIYFIAGTITFVMTLGFCFFCVKK